MQLCARRFSANVSPYIFGKFVPLGFEKMYKRICYAILYIYFSGNIITLSFLKARPLNILMNPLIYLAFRRTHNLLRILNCP